MASDPSPLDCPSCLVPLGRDYLCPECGVTWTLAEAVKAAATTHQGAALASGSDFERWLVGSRTPPDERDPDALCAGIAAAIGSREFEAAVALLKVLALRDPGKAQRAHDIILAVADGDERRATLLAVFHG